MMLLLLLLLLYEQGVNGTSVEHINAPAYVSSLCGSLRLLTSERKKF